MNNTKLFRAFIEDKDSQLIWEALLEELKLCAMTPPRVTRSSKDVKDCVGSRRFMVEQVKEKNGQRIQAHRQIDHLT